MGTIGELLEELEDKLRAAKALASHAQADLVNGEVGPASELIGAIADKLQQGLELTIWLDEFFDERPYVPERRALVMSDTDEAQRKAP